MGENPRGREKVGGNLAEVAWSAPSLFRVSPFRDNILRESVFCFNMEELDNIRTL